MGGKVVEFVFFRAENGISNQNAHRVDFRVLLVQALQVVEKTKTTDFPLQKYRNEAHTEYFLSTGVRVLV